MYLGSIGGNLLKAQMQNSSEKLKCDLHKEDIAKDRLQTLYTINKRIRDVQNTLIGIKSTSGYCKEARGTNDTVSQSNISQMPQSHKHVEHKKVQSVEGSELKAEMQVCNKMQENKNSAFYKQDFNVNFRNKIQYQRDPKTTAIQRAAISGRSTSCLADTADKSTLPCAVINGQSRKELDNVPDIESPSSPIAFLLDSNGNVWAKEEECDKGYGSLENKLEARDAQGAPRLPGEHKLMQTGERNVKGSQAKQRLSSAWHPSATEFISSFKESRGADVGCKGKCRGADVGCKGKCRGADVGCKGKCRGTGVGCKGKCTASVCETMNGNGIGTGKGSAQQHVQEKNKQHGVLQLPKPPTNKSDHHDKGQQHLHQQHIYFDKTQERYICCQATSVLKETIIDSPFELKSIGDVSVQVSVCNTEKCNRRIPFATMNVSVSKPRAKSAPVFFYRSQDRSVDFIKKSSRAKDVSMTDFGKVKIQVNLSKTARKRMLQKMVSDSHTSFDRTLYEKERQKLLQEKITTFIASLKEQSDKDQM